ncbi:MAG: tRNA (guanosine(37)-N1)-methyltransferase TrmD [Bacteroidetes bacterium]|nr:tRNA (guanosine(37)-N1)-methyltransferase TrmD [Bacteroidota bacterium]
MSILRIDLIAAVPDIFQSPLESSILKRAQEKGLVTIVTHNLHDYAKDAYKHIDDTPFGGGAGMILQCEPIFECIEQLMSERTYDEIIYTSPDGQVFNQDIANELSLKGNIIILAGHYKGIDQRVRDHLITREISIGDVVLSGGELPALMISDAIVRLVPGVLGDAESSLSDAFMNEGLLDCPHYTRPAVFRGMEVPEVLRSGNHALIEEWRIQQSVEKTKQLRPDIFDKYKEQ